MYHNRPGAAASHHLPTAQRRLDSSFIHPTLPEHLFEPHIHAPHRSSKETSSILPPHGNPLMTVQRNGSITSFKLLRRRSTDSSTSTGTKATTRSVRSGSDHSARNDFQQTTSHVPKRVRFGTVSIREYPLVLGNNPSCSFGPPLELGSTPISEYEINLELYEKAKPPTRSKAELIIPPQLKVTILQSNGYTLRQIAHAIQQQEASAEHHRTRKRSRIRKRMGSFGTLQSRSFSALTQRKCVVRPRSQTACH